MSDMKFKYMLLEKVSTVEERDYLITLRRIYTELKGAFECLDEAEFLLMAGKAATFLGSIHGMDSQIPFEDLKKMVLAEIIGKHKDM